MSEQTAMSSSDQVKGAQFAMVPFSLIQRFDISLSEYGLLTALAQYANTQGYCWPSQSTLAKYTGRSRAWVNSTLKKLAEKNSDLIQLRKRFNAEGFQTSNMYFLPWLKELHEARKDQKAVKEADTGCQQDLTEGVQNDNTMEHTHQQDSLEQGEINSLSKSESEKTIVDDEWRPSQASVDWAAKSFPRTDLHAFTMHFVQSCQANGYAYLDPEKGWKAWLLDGAARRFAKSKSPNKAKRSAKCSPGGDVRLEDTSFDGLNAALAKVQSRQGHLNATQGVSL